MTKAQATAKRTQLTLKTYTRFPRRRLPLIFQETYGNIYPDARDDVLGGPVKKVKYDAIVLENPHIRVTIVPDLGGKIWSVYDKHAKRETLHVPDCVKPGMVFVCGAWIAGGMEFNFPIGHHVDSMSPLPTHIAEEGPDRAVAVVERICRRTGLRMEVRTVLRADEACFDLSITVSNPTAVSQRWYQWTNVGVTAGPKWRFFSKGNLYTGGMGIDTYPVSRNGKDISWYMNRPTAGDNFMVGLREDYFGCYDYDKEHGLAHWAPWQQIPGKKYFTWGSTQRSYDSGRNLNDSGDDYLEIQTGPMETQGHFAMLAPGETRTFTGTWWPYRQTGGIEWATRSLLLNVREDGSAWLYATAAVEAEIVINSRKHHVKLRPAEVVRLRARVRKGDRIEIAVNGKRERTFTYPLKGRMEPNAEQRCLKEQKLFEAAFKRTIPDTAGGALALARQMVKYDFSDRAVNCYRKALQIKPTLHEARLELAETLMRMGEVKAAEEHLAKLLKTKAAGKAKELLARREAAERAFMAPVLAQPKGPKRDLALAERCAGYNSFERAARLYRKLLKSHPRNPRVHYGMAMYLWHVKKDRARAMEHADRALQLQPGDRDLLIELCLLYLQAGRHDRVLGEIGKAAPAVRKLAILQKHAARSYLETGRLDKCWKILTTVRLHNWEGEFGHVEAFVDCALAMAEQALVKGDVAAARERVDLAADLGRTPTLGVLRGHGNNERVAFWQGLVALHEGNRTEAERTWRGIVGPIATMKRLPVKLGEWYTPPKPENEYLRVMAAVALGETKTARQATKLLARLRDEWVKGDLQRHPAPVDLLDGMVAELEGEFGRAEKLFAKYLSTAAIQHLAQNHLNAVRAGQRRYENLLTTAPRDTQKMLQEAAAGA